MKVNEPNELEGMSKKKAIQLAALFLSAAIEPSKWTEEFQMLVYSSAGVVDELRSQGLVKVIESIDEATVESVVTPTDCETDRRGACTR